MEEAFAKWTRRRTVRLGYWITCKKGLWKVFAPTKAEAEREAMRYFAQYYGDGEYA